MVALQAVEVTATSPQGALAVALLKEGATGGGAAPQGGRTTTVLKHRGGNKQVLTARGERWHLSRDKDPGDIPLRDPVGDQLQEAVTRVFDLRPAAIIRDLDLLRPIYQQTAAYGHFGREIPELLWENTDRAADLKNAAA